MEADAVVVQHEALDVRQLQVQVLEVGHVALVGLVALRALVLLHDLALDFAVHRPAHRLPAQSLLQPREHACHGVHTCVQHTVLLVLRRKLRLVLPSLLTAQDFRVLAANNKITILLSVGIIMGAIFTCTVLRNCTRINHVDYTGTIRRPSISPRIIN